MGENINNDQQLLEGGEPQMQETERKYKFLSPE